MAIKKALVIYGGSIEELHAGDSLGASGDVTGPSASTDNAIARFDGTTGKLIQDSNVTVDDAGSIGGVNSLKLDTTPTVATPIVGEIYWDEGNKTPSIQLENDVNLQLGQEIVTLCYNGTGSTIPNGSVVAVTGAQGQRPSIALADADSESTSARTLGITTQAIADGAEGFITSFGFVRGLDTSAITAGVAVYLSQTAGQFTATKPSAPAHLVHLGYVIKSHASAGEVFVTINNGWEFDELHDVLITDLQSGQIPIRDQVLGVWKNITINGTTNEVTVTSTKDGITISLPDTISASITGNAATVTNGLYTTDLGVSVQGYDADLSAIAGLAGTTGLLRKTAANTWSLDTTAYTTNTGTVTSVALTLPTGLTVSGSPITTSGTLAVTFSAGYSIPTTSDQTNWNTAYGWGNHASAGYLTTSVAASTYQPLDNDLTAIAALAGATGLLRKTAANTWSLDTTAYTTNTGTVTSVTAGTGLSGGTITSSGTIGLANTAVTAGSYTSANITVDAQGRLTAASSGASPSAFPAGTAMLFVQTAAPTGWTKSTAHDNKALRIVSGTASSGGSVAFTTAFASQAVNGSNSSTTATGTIGGSFTVGNTTLATTQIPSHNHVASAGAYSSTFGSMNPVFGVGQESNTRTIGNTGGGGSHTHSISGSPTFTGTAHTHTFTGTAINLAVSYVDAIIATKD